MDQTQVLMTDPDAWVEGHADALFRFAVARLGDRTVAEDLVQETFLAALNARRDFRGESSERTWLISILRHKLVDHLRKRDRVVPLAEECTDERALDTLFQADGHWRRMPARWDADPDALSENAEFWAIFANCRDALPGRQAAVLTQRLMDDLPAADICRTLEISEANLWVLLHRARTRLRECLERHWFAP